MRERKDILLVGYFISHIVGSKVELLKEMGYHVHALDLGNYSVTENIYCPDSLRTYSGLNHLNIYRKRIHLYANEVKEMMRNYNFINEEKQMYLMAHCIIEEIQPDIIWGVWGSGILKWLRIFYKVGYSGSMIWTANVLPNNISNFKWSTENILYKKWLHKMGKIILTGNRMLEFMQKEYPKTKYTNNLLLPDYLPQSWFAKKGDSFSSKQEYHVIYLGAPERYGKEIDRVDSYLLEMANGGIHVHCALPQVTSIEHPLIHFYDRFDDASFVNGEFGQFINQFDAAIVMYNYDGYHPRFASTFPTRFLVALCGCIPIFIKKGLLLTCEEFIENNGIGKAYDDIFELKKMLMNDDLMYSLRKRSQQNVTKFASNCFHNKDVLKQFFQEV
jgi:hypothetical protein